MLCKKKKVNCVSGVSGEFITTCGSYIPIKLTWYKFFIIYAWNIIYVLLHQVRNWGLFSTCDTFGSLVLQNRNFQTFRVNFLCCAAGGQWSECVKHIRIFLWKISRGGNLYTSLAFMFTVQIDWHSLKQSSSPLQASA